MVYFVSDSKNVNGNTFASYNVHNLIHLKEDAVNFKSSLDNISAFPFENHLQILKKLVRKPQNPISQIVKRLDELESCDAEFEEKALYTKLTTKHKDSWFLLKSGKFVCVKELYENHTYMCDVYNKDRLESYFMQPCDSKHFNIAFLRDSNHKPKRQLIDRESILRKTVVIPHNHGMVFVPLVHNVKWAP